MVLVPLMLSIYRIAQGDMKRVSCNTDLVLSVSHAGEHSLQVLDRIIIHLLRSETDKNKGLEQYCAATNAGDAEELR